MRYEGTHVMEDDRARGEETAMEIEDANEMVIRAALRRLGTHRQGDPAELQKQIAEVVKDQGKAIFAQLSEGARRQLYKEGLRINEQTARIERIEEAIDYGRWLISRYKVETLGELLATVACATTNESRSR